MEIALQAHAPALLERDAQLRSLEAALAHARGGRGRAIRIEGQAGTGKSRLLAETATLARAAGMQVLAASGEGSERDFAFGVALQLFEETVRRLAADDRSELFAGTARLARPLLEGDPRTDPQGLFSLVQGLYWVTHGFAARQPLLLAVDDAQWADAESLRLIAYLRRRMADLPVALVIAHRLGERENGRAPLAELGEAPGEEVLAVGPLSLEAATELVRRRFRDADTRFCAACAQATAGNPFYLQELLRTIAIEEVPPTEAGVEQVRLLRPDSVSRSILLRLSRLAPEAALLARAVAILGEASLLVAAELVQLDRDAAAAAAGALAAAGVLADREPLSFSHPIVRGVVLGDAVEAERGRLHLRAAGLLLEAGAAPERAASHVLASPPSGEPWVIAPLCDAAAHALASGAPASAVRYLRRALAESPPPEALAGVLIELGQAEAAAAQPEAPERFRAALALSDAPLERAAIQLQLGRVLIAQGRLLESAEAFERGAGDARGRDADLVAELDAGYLAVSRLEPSLYPAAAERIERLVAQPPEADAPALRPLLADVALAHAWAGAPAARVLPLARRAWAGGALLAEQGPDGQALFVLTGALISVDALAFDIEVLDATLQQARQQGAVMAVATASIARAFPLYRRAHVSEALADAEQAVQAERDGWQMFVPIARAFCALCLLERGDVAGAERPLDLGEPAYGLDALPFVPYLEARARVRLAQRRPQEALEDALQAGVLLEETFAGTHGRGYSDWRCVAALAAVAVGDDQRAARLCKEDLSLARAGDRAREIGVALRTTAALDAGERRIERLEESVTALERSESTLELLRSLVDLGGALRRAGRRVDARQPLARALDLASARGATALAQRAREELLATGARPRRTAQRGVDSLTPSELRVARLAADGLRNREIAEALFVTGKTVDYHLRHVYQKLGVRREELAGLLAAKP